MTEHLRHDRLLFWLSFVAFVAWLIVGLVVKECFGAERTTGLATYYTTASCQREGTSGVRTANGDPYDETQFTAALRRRDFGHRYRVCNAARPRQCVVVRHNDYGPGVRATARGVVIDLTPAAYDTIGCPRGVTKRGVAWGECEVTVEPVS